jgi:hypothetical protein
MTDSADPRLAGLNVGDVRGIASKLTTDRALWVLVVGALLVLMALRGAFRGALGD